MRQQPDVLPVLNTALKFRDCRGFAPVPIIYKAKRPPKELKDWVAFEGGDDALRRWFGNGPMNIGLILGKASGGLVDVDLDVPEAISLAPSLLPYTDLRHGRDGARGSHHWYLADPPDSKTEKFADPVDGKMLVELRGAGAQTCIPPSIHPSGAVLEWEAEGEPTRIAYRDLRPSVAKTAAASALARHWPESGSRHQAALALAGLLIRGGWGFDETKHFVTATARAAGDEEWRERAGDVVTTVEKLAKHKPATGAPTLTKYMPEVVVRKVAEWLEIDWTSAPERGSQRRPVLVSLADVEPRLVEWAWEGRIPRGAVTVIDGDPGLGKSTLTLDLAARVTKGRPMPDGSAGVEGGVVLLSAEDDVSRTIVPRLQAAGADRSRIVVLSAVTAVDGKEELPSFPTDLSALEEAITQIDAVLVVVDPLMAFLDDDVNANSDKDVRRALHPLAKLAESTGVAVLVVRHLNKNMESTNAKYRGGGSIGIIGAARSAMLVVQDPDDDDTNVLAVSKCNLAPLAPSLTFRMEEHDVDGIDNVVAGIEWGEETFRTASELLEAGRGGARHGSAIDEAREFIRQELAGGRSVPAQDMFSRAGQLHISESTLNRAKRALGVLSKRCGGAAGDGSWEWELPDTESDEEVA